ncbi:MAG: hypothetical protein K8T91_15865 [Planctomycetes bacterium]|nr:hypothetical protein [Planctomycetota bacterium]
MNQQEGGTRITLRIPGCWSHPRELLERMPAEFVLRPEVLVAPDGTEFEFTPVPPDQQFPGVFQSACCRPLEEEQRTAIAGYTVNICLSGPGGSLATALAMMQAGAAVLRAGGIGVFIDNSARAHGGEDWLAMTEDGGSDAISFAFVSVIRGRGHMYTMGMQVLGFPNLLMRPLPGEEPGESLVELIRYISAGGPAVDVGHVLADEVAPRYQVVARENDEFPPESAMHNPHGRLKIVSIKEISEGN